MSGLSAKVRDEHALNCILKSRAKEKQTANDEIYDLTTLRTITNNKKPTPRQYSFSKSHKSMHLCLVTSHVPGR